MSHRGVGNLLRSFGVSAFFLLAVPACSWAQGCANGACFGTPNTGSCGPDGCQMFHCPPAFQHCVEGPPCIHWKHGCPRPVCNPCDLPHWGYFDKCWTPWPFPPNWTHCPQPPPAAFVTLNPGVVNPGVVNPGAPTYMPTLPPRVPPSGGATGPMPPPAFPGVGPMPIGGQDTLPQPQRFEMPASRVPY